MKPLPTGSKDLEEMEAEAFMGSFSCLRLHLSTYFWKMLGTQVYYLLSNHLKDIEQWKLTL